MSLVWIPKFKVGDCIKWAGYEELCIVNIKNYPEGGTYTFKNGGTMWGPSIDDGLDALEGLEGLSTLFPKDINNTTYNINTNTKIIITLGFNNKLFI